MAGGSLRSVHCDASALAWFHGERGEQRVTRLEIFVLTGLLALAGGIIWIFVRHSPPAPAPASAVLAARSRIAIPWASRQPARRAPRTRSAVARGMVNMH